MVSLVPANATFLLWSLLVGLVAFGFWSEQNTRVGRTITGVIVAMAAAMFLSNVRVLPFASPVYDSIFHYLLPIAIPLTLFRADLVEALRKGGATVAAFGIGCVGVIIGVFVATLVVPLGEISSMVAGLYTATYTGGSANLAATAIATDFVDSYPSELTALVAADVVATNIQTLAIVALPSIAILRRLFAYDDSTTSHEAAQDSVKPFTAKKIDLTGAMLALSVAMALVYLGKITAAEFDQPTMAIVYTTVYALIISNFFKPLVRRMSLDFELGVVLLFLFLVALAAGADIAVLVRTGVAYFAFAIVVLAIHTVIIVAVAKLFRLDLASVVVGSTACIGGVTTAAAIASAKGWKHLIIPGILAGTLGNAIGTLLGVWVWTFLS